MTRLAVTLLVSGLLALLSSPTSASAAQPISFAALTDGDTLWVSYGSCGCKHVYRAEFTLLGRQPDVAHLKLWDPWSPFGRGEPEIRDVRLTAADRTGIDKLIAYNETSRWEGCTPWDQIDLWLSHKGRRSAPVHFYEASCNAEYQPGVLLLRELISRK